MSYFSMRQDVVYDVYDIGRLVTWSLGLATFEPPYNYCRCFSIVQILYGKIERLIL